jgi:hypothetical protein
MYDIPPNIWIGHMSMLLFLLTKKTTFATFWSHWWSMVNYCLCISCFKIIPMLSWTPFPWAPSKSLVFNWYLQPSNWRKWIRPKQWIWMNHACKKTKIESFSLNCNTYCAMWYQVCLDLNWAMHNSNQAKCDL